ncbi:hypothetical protein SBDP1_620034 [Syntrophobacter sp. SbD1]|nr:hypothetical protein SBDP1_620034 [Syntrophobacter sp. SbD1]
MPFKTGGSRKKTKILTTRGKLTQEQSSCKNYAHGELFPSCRGPPKTQ